MCKPRTLFGCIRLSPSNLLFFNLTFIISTTSYIVREMIDLVQEGNRTSIVRIVSIEQNQLGIERLGREVRHSQRTL